MAYNFVKNLSDESIKKHVRDPLGQRVLVLILAEIADGWSTSAEKDQRDRLMRFIPSDYKENQQSLNLPSSSTANAPQTNEAEDLIK